MPIKVTDDVPSCETVYEQKCEEVTKGYETQKECETWPREICSLSKQEVTKFTPETVCEKVPKELCAPKGCGFRHVIFKMNKNGQNKYFSKKIRISHLE